MPLEYMYRRSARLDRVISLSNRNCKVCTRGNVYVLEVNLDAEPLLHHFPTSRFPYHGLLSNSPPPPPPPSQQPLLSYTMVHQQWFEYYVNFTQTLQFLLDNDILPYMLNISLESRTTVKRLVVYNLCNSTQEHCAVNSAN